MKFAQLSVQEFGTEQLLEMQHHPQLLHIPVLRLTDSAMPRLHVVSSAKLSSSIEECPANKVKRHPPILPLSKQKSRWCSGLIVTDSVLRLTDMLPNCPWRRYWHQLQHQKRLLLSGREVGEGMYCRISEWTRSIVILQDNELSKMRSQGKSLPLCPVTRGKCQFF